MDNLHPTNPIANPGIEAALVRLGHAVRDAALTIPDIPSPPVPFGDKLAISTALVYLGTRALCPLPPTMAVALIDDLAREIPGAVDARAQS